MARKSRKKPNMLPPPSPTAEVCYAGAYIRLSVEDEQSAFNQEQLIRQFFIQHDDLILSRLYVDDGRSSFIGIRPEFDRMIVDARNKEISCIVVKDFSRFARDYIELGNYLEQMFPMWGTRFISILDDYYTTSCGSFISIGFLVYIGNEMNCGIILIKRLRGDAMSILYNKLWDVLKERGVSGYRLRKDKVIGHETLEKLRNSSGHVDTRTIDRLCAYLNVQPGEIMEYVPGSSKDEFPESGGD